jgi:hypothetical protein
MASLEALFRWVETFESSVAIRESENAYPLLLTIHLIGMCLFAGLIIMMDLRLLGVGNMRTPFSEVQRRLFPWQIAGMVISAVSGLILVYGQPMRYYFNVFFWTKVMMMCLAGINAMAFHDGTYHSIAKWDMSRATPKGARLAAVVSLALWAFVIISGRLIAYNWFNPT